MEKNSISLERQIQLKIQGYSYTVNFPTVGQIIDFETQLSTFSRGEHRRMIEDMFPTRSKNLALDYIETISFVLAFLPDDIKNNLRIDSLFKLDILAMKEIVNEYKYKFKPWYDAWIDEVNKEDEERSELIKENEEKRDEK